MFIESCVGGPIEFDDESDGNAIGEIRMTLNESEGVVTSSKRDDVSLIFSWNKVFKPMHYKNHLSCFILGKTGEENIRV